MKSLSLNDLQHRVALQKDQAAYKQLFFHYYPGLVRFSLGYVKTKEAAEEVVSDVLLKIWTLNERLLSVDNLTVYLYRATRNRSLNYIRDGQRHQAQSLHLLDDQFEYRQRNPEESVLGNEWQQQLQLAVSSLPPKCQAVYKLIREDGFTYKEAAAVLNISENTVDRHLNNALHKMVKSVREYVL